MRSLLLSCVFGLIWLSCTSAVGAQEIGANVAGFMMFRNNNATTPGESYQENDLLKVNFFCDFEADLTNGGSFTYEIYWLDDAHGATLTDSGHFVCQGQAGASISTSIVAPNPEQGDRYPIIYIYDSAGDQLFTTASNPNFVPWFAGS